MNRQLSDDREVMKNEDGGIPIFKTLPAFASTTQLKSSGWA